MTYRLKLSLSMAALRALIMEETIFDSVPASEKRAVKKASAFLHGCVGHIQLEESFARPCL